MKIITKNYTKNALQFVALGSIIFDDRRNAPRNLTENLKKNPNLKRINNLRNLHRIKLIAFLTCIIFSASAQSQDVRSTLQSVDATIPFRAGDAGTKLPDITWGLDLSWISEGNVQRGLNFAGQDLIDIIRLSFQTTAKVDDDLVLSEAQQEILDERIRIAKLAKNATVNLNSDQEAGVDTWYHTSASASQPDVYAPRWVNLIVATKNYVEAKGLKVESISPFNEPDYADWKQGSKAEFLAICKLLKEREDCQNVVLCGCNTLNDDYALSWYNSCKSHLDEGNTHQLAGDFDHFANFFKQVKADGKRAVDDELHNSMEAMVGSEYGITKAIWWGTCDHTRSEFMKASRGTRLGYAEHRNNWTAASVYRHPEGHIHGFGGTSERQAVTTTFRFAALDHDVFYNGQGPTREYLMMLPGGNGYQKGQTNAETLVNIQDGEDIMPMMPTTPTAYKLVNRFSGLVLSTTANSTTNGAVLAQEKNVATGTTSKVQQWILSPMSPRSGGDFSYYKIMNVKDTALVLDVKDWSLTDKGSLIAYKGGIGDNEQWFLEYAGEGYFYIRSRHSAYCIEVTPGSDTQQKLARRPLCQGIPNGSAIQQWRLIPINVVPESVAPATPTNLTATALPVGVKLQWDAFEEKDFSCYHVLRSTDNITWNTIHAAVTTPSYIDNTATQTSTYYYKVRALDTNGNRSPLSEVVCATPTGEPALISHLAADSALTLDGTQQFVQLPATIANTPELSISLWVYWRGGAAWQRIFDFGTDTDHYLFVTPSCGTGPRLAIKNGGSEQTLSLGSLFGTMKWRHLVVTLSTEAITVYLDGKQVAQSTSIIDRPAAFQPIFNYIGRSQFSSDPLFKGSIEDLRIYNYALSSSEVKDLYDTKTGIDADVDVNANPQPSPIYNLAGQVLATPPTSGFYIHQGRVLSSFLR